MSQLVRARHPKIILGVVGALIAVPVLGITMSLVGTSANAPQEVSMQDMSMEESAQDTTSVQQETVPTVAAAVVVVESQPAQSPLPDPLAPEPTRDSSPESEMTAEPKKTAEAETATPTPTSKPKGTKTPEPPVMNEPKIVKKTSQVVGGWTPPVVNPGTVSLRAPQLTSGQRVTLTVACSPSANCVINGDQLTITEGTQVTVTYRAKATGTHRAWTTTIRSE
jgi:cytoskeletal protein RodZ